MKRLPNGYTEQTLIQELKKKDRQAFTVLYEQYSAALFGVISRIIKDDAVAEDILQETFIKIYQRIDLYDPVKSRLFTWLINIARNATFDILRKNRTAIFLAIDDENIPAIDYQHQVSQPNVAFIGIPEFVNKRSLSDRNLIDLIYFNGYTMSEVSAELDMPIGTVKTKVRSALKQLRNLTG